MVISINRSSRRELLTRAEAAEFLSVKPQTLAKWASTKRYDIPFVKIGNAIRYRRSDLLQYMASNTFGAVSGQ